jgi:hypothetical protein
VAQYAGVIRLLEIFGKHVSLLANQVALGEAQAEARLFPELNRAKATLFMVQSDISRVVDPAPCRTKAKKCTASQASLWPRIDRRRSLLTL